MVSSVLLLRQNLRDFSITQEICLLFMLLKCGVWSVLDKRAVPIAGMRIRKIVPPMGDRSGRKYSGDKSKLADNLPRQVI